MTLVYLCCGIISLAMLRLMNAENVLTDWNTGDGGFKWRPKCDFWSRFVGMIPIRNATREECGRFCIADPYCSYFDFDRLGNCYMDGHVVVMVHQDHDYESIAICGFIPWRLDSETGRDDWKSSIESGFNNCRFYANGNAVITTDCRQAIDCSYWYHHVRSTNGSTACKLVDGSSGSCCPFSKRTLYALGEQYIRMIPDERERIIDAGTTLTLTCVYAFENEHEKDYNFSWLIPDYLAKNVELTELDNRLRKTFGRNETHITSTLYLSNTRPKDTGYFGCRGSPHEYSAPVNQYVYVFSPTELIITDHEGYYKIPSGETNYPIKCRPTHPDVNVSLIHSHHLTAREPEGWLLGYPDLLADPNSNWSFEPKSGLKLKKAKIDDSGQFFCKGNYKEEESAFSVYLNVSGMELTRTDGVGNPLEGSNVNLSCRTYVYTASSTRPKWSYQINGNGKMEIINKKNPPEGIEIKERSQYVFRDKTLCESELSLLDISPSTYTFQCQGSGFTENISFRVVESNGNSKLKSIQLQKNIAQNLTCIRGSNRNRILWFKDGKEYPGPVYSDNVSSILPLQGKAEEKGSYACLWKNNFVGENYVNFTVSLQSEEIPPIDKTVVIAVSSTFAVLLFILIVSIGVKFYFDKKRRVSQEALIRLLKGNIDQIKKQSPIEEQIEFLPYDKRWEFPRNRLKLGIQLGAGCFGRVVKAEAVGLKDSEETVKTVAVKMVRSEANIAAMEALIGELKILIYLGSHLNVVNLLGACTKQIHKGELLVTVEYCRFGSLQTFLISHRNNFINLVDDFGNLKTQGEMESNNIARANVCEPSQQASDPSDMNSSTEILDVSANFNQHNLDADFNRPISTTDLISWSFQIARGMDYLVSKKVLHGDLAARNILLADDGVAKVADFGMARKMYYEENYEKNGQGLMPVKWMAIESLTDRIFSSQSDMWSYGILLWELFSLGKVPYPGMDVGHILMKEILNGYRMEKPAFAPNIFGEMMANCWKTDPKMRPTFSQLEEIICGQLESSVTSDYLNMNALYEKLNEERENATPKDHFGLAKLLREKSRAQPANEEKSRYSSFSMRFSKRDANEDLSF